jgi:hypothetical protein
VVGVSEIRWEGCATGGQIGGISGGVWPRGGAEWLGCGGKLRSGGQWTGGSGPRVWDLEIGE